MRSTRVLLALALLVTVGAGIAAAQQNFTDPGNVPTGPFPVINDIKPFGSLTFYPDRASFQAANPGLPIEDFSGTSVPPGGITACDAPLNSATNDACFSAGSVIPGFTLNVIPDGGGGQYVVLNNALGMPCVGVGPNSFVDETDWDLGPAVAAVAFDLYTPLGGGEPFTVEVFGPGGSLGSAPIVGGGTAPSFFGVDSVDPGGITRVEIREGIDSTGDLYCDLEFGGAPVPVELQSIDVE
jgi:hypothetical protein